MLRASLLAIAAKCRLNCLRCVPSIVATAWFVFSSMTWMRLIRGLPSKQMRDERFTACLNCPLYDRTLQTCGTPGQDYIDKRTGRAESYGCLCFMPLKRKFHVNCWLWLRTGGTEGWPDHLNADYYVQRTD